MKNVIIKILAILLAIWYSMSIIGFDVHTCSGSGRSFVVTFIEGLTCEDIHPEHSCDKASCCEHSNDVCCSGHAADCAEPTFGDGTTIAAKSCCSNDYQVLTLTGTIASNDHEHFDECACGLCPCTDLPVYYMAGLCHEDNLIIYVPSPGSGAESACERQAALRVWRI